MTDEDRQRIIRKYLDAVHSSSGLSSSQAIGDEENPRIPDPDRDPSAAADLSLADGQHSAQRCSPVGSSPTADSAQPSREESRDGSNE
jgi:hypothetical protein